MNAWLDVLAVGAFIVALVLAAAWCFSGTKDTQGKAPERNQSG